MESEPDERAQHRKRLVASKSKFKCCYSLNWIQDKTKQNKATSEQLNYVGGIVLPDATGTHTIKLYGYAGYNRQRARFIGDAKYLAIFINETAYCVDYRSFCIVPCLQS